ncbi:ATP-binding cassette domain-containing protein [Streptomyces sviceus]|uniref:D-methionine ABC transporter, ATP-binding protein n=1 Tax=Streptomyces sviceus (strain ATCC 29083 / DSM 924 / JCM 4929 / NBRC 13980 / NCIMB 11184 / NRRL 5439 / UC 5370) TaxID=463191 RepID=B5I886_STRX2|nr:D-methionine ABC transporter, ATP-binding protein [Streptomyces sviceus ATCC 29083]
MSLVHVTNLTVEFGDLRAVDGLSFRLEQGAALALVGESGSGKSTVASALLGLHRGTGARVGGSVEVAGVDVQQASDEELRRLRGAKAAMVFQDPLSSLDPYYAIGDQIAEVYRVHTRGSRRAARARAVEVLDRVGIPDAVRRSRSRPHEFSGGMRQRALIAMALACEPALLIADEPTTALDVTVQAQILDLLHTLRRQTGMGLLIVTHDVGVAAESVDDVLVMRHGRAVEQGPVAAVLGAPGEAYTRELLAAVPRLDAPRAPSRASDEVVLEAKGLRREFGRGKKAFAAVDDVSLTVRRGETLGVVGESGSGKTTLGRMLVGLLEPTAGEVRHDGHARVGVNPAVQMVFQDPVSSLNPRRSVGESIADPLRARGERDEQRIRGRVTELLERFWVFKGRTTTATRTSSVCGQRQRVGIARALAADPRVFVLRRTGLRPRRHHPGPGGGPARRVAAGARTRAGLRRARPRRRTPGQRPRRRDATRPDRRTGAGGRGLRKPAGPVHPATPGRRTGARSAHRGPAQGGAPGSGRDLTFRVRVIS